MKTHQKTALSLLLSVLAFSAGAVLMYSGLFDYIEANFYDPRVRDRVQSTLDRGVDALGSYHANNQERFQSILAEPAVRSVYQVNQSREDILARRNFFNRLEDQVPALAFVRFIDAEGERLWYSNRDSDVVSESDFRREYAALSEIDETPAPEDLVLEANAEADIVLDPESNHFVYRFPVEDSYGLVRGTALFYLSPRGATDALVRNDVIGAGERVLIVNEDLMIANQASRFGQGLREELSGVFEEPPREDSRSPVITSPSGADYLAFSANVEEVGRLAYLSPASAFQMNETMRWILLSATFLSVFLLSFLLLNLRQDPEVILTERVKRFQINLLREMFETGEKPDWEQKRIELEERRDEVNREIKRGIGRLSPEKEKEVDQLLNKSWDEIVSVIGNRAREADRGDRIDIERLEDMIEKVISNFASLPASGTAGAGPSPAGAAATTGAAGAKAPDSPPPSDGSSEAAEPAEEPAELEEAEEPEPAEEPAEAEESADFTAGMRPVEVESADDDEELEELGEVEEAAEEPETAEEPEEVEAAEEPETAEEPEELEEAEELESAEEPAEAEESADFTAGMRPVEVESADDDEELEELGEVEEAAEELETAEEAEELEEAEEPEAAEEPEELEEAEELESAEETGDVAEFGTLQETEELESMGGPRGEAAQSEAAQSEAAQSEAAEGEAAEGEAAQGGEIEGTAEAPTYEELLKDLSEVKEEWEREGAEVVSASDEKTEAEHPENGEKKPSKEEPEDVVEVQGLDQVDELEELDEPEEFDEPEAEELTAEEPAESEFQEAASYSDELGEEPEPVFEELEPVEASDQGSEAPQELSTAKAGSYVRMSDWFSFGQHADHGVRQLEEEQEGEEAELVEELEEVEEAAPVTPSASEPSSPTSEEEGGPYELRDDLVVIVSPQETNNAYYELLRLDLRLSEGSEDKRVFTADDGVVRIDDDVYQESQETEGDEVRHLIESITGESEEGGTSGIDDLFASGSGLDLLPVGERGSETTSGPEVGSGDRKPTFGAHGLDYDAILSGYPNNDGGVLKSLVEFTRSWGTRAAGVLLPGKEGLHMEYSLAIEESCRQQFIVPHDSDVYRQVLAERSLLLTKEPLHRYKSFRGLCSEAAFAYIGRVLFVPVVFRKSEGYLLLGVHDNSSDIETLLSNAGMSLSSDEAAQEQS